MPVKPKKMGRPETPQNARARLIASSIGITLPAVVRKFKMGMSEKDIYLEADMRKKLKAAGGTSRSIAQAGITKKELKIRREARLQGEDPAVAVAAYRKSGSTSISSLPPTPDPFDEEDGDGSPDSPLYSKKDGSKDRKSAPDGGESLYMANHRKARADADRVELEVKQKRGELADVGKINAWFSGVVIRAKEIIMGIPDLVDRIRQSPTEGDARKLAEGECRRALEELGKYAQFEAEMGGGGGGVGGGKAGKK